jgi:hypothetical protein
VWFSMRLTLLGRLMIACLLLFGGPVPLLYVWCRLNPRPYDGVLAPRLGLFVSGGALDALEGD